MIGETKMAKDLDKIVVVDVESTCWDSKPPDGEVSEIIEIGVAVLAIGDKICEIEDNVGIIIKPENSKISKYCTTLTTLTQSQVDKGVSFERACELLRNFKTKKRVWASWGDYDRVQFYNNCKLYNVNYPFGKTHINIKYLFTLVSSLDKELSMSQALKSLGMDTKGTHHRGIDDAFNIASILGDLIVDIRR